MKSLVSVRYKSYSTNDPLDAGEALWLSHFFPEFDYSKQLKSQAATAVESLYKYGEFTGNPQHRLAFREFGTTIGVQMHNDLWQKEWNQRVEELHQFWDGSLYSRDNDITPIMFCTSLIPGVFINSYLDSQ
uniref:Uncharacterized protein n=1 Tax=Panagrolaimus davidi TaxID=227884 RepID=A0A914PBS8_9BILA